jgi:hypothetical protein
MMFSVTREKKEEKKRMHGAATHLREQSAGVVMHLSDTPGIAHTAESCPSDRPNRESLAQLVAVPSEQRVSAPDVAMIVPLSPTHGKILRTHTVPLSLPLLPLLATGVLTTP